MKQLPLFLSLLDRIDAETDGGLAETAVIAIVFLVDVSPSYRMVAAVIIRTQSVLSTGNFGVGLLCGG